MNIRRSVSQRITLAGQVAWAAAVLATGSAQAQEGESAAPAAQIDDQQTTNQAAAPAGTPPPRIETHTEAQAPADGAKLQPAATATTAAPVPGWLKNLDLGGGAILWFYNPVDIAGANSNVDLFFANLLLDGKVGAFGLHIEPRFRDSRLRSFFGGPVWAQEAYGSARLGQDTVLKVGKAYSRFGLFWDNSFYGNVQVYDGLKLDPDYGISLEGALRPAGESGLRYWAQFFIVDGQTNVSLTGRDTISIPGARRRNQAILRVEPFYKVTDNATITAGLSGAFLQADLAAAGKKNVFRGAADVSVSVQQWSAWAEYTHQSGQTVTDHPIAGVPATAATAAVPGRASARNNYALAGTQYAFGPLTLRYNVSTGRYEDLSISEWMHVPALAWAVSSNFTLLGEYVDWRRFTPQGNALVDRSANITLHGHF